MKLLEDMTKRDFVIGLLVTLTAFLISYHLPRIINRNV
jgi:hypothetical protein